MLLCNFQFFNNWHYLLETNVIDVVYKLIIRNTMGDTFKPGQSAPKSGQYGIVGPRGGKTGVERTVVKGEPFPPTLQKGQGYVMNDPTKTK